VLTRRTIFVSILLLLVVGGVIGLLALAINRQHEAAHRARVSQTVISAANLTEQRLLAVQTNIRGYLIRGNRDVLVDYRIARAALPDATLDLQTLVERDPAQGRRADQIRQEALSYVNDYGDPVVARTREDGVTAGRSFASANDGGARADGLLKRIEELAATEQVQSEELAREADAWSDRALLIALLGLILCVLALVAVTAYVARRIVMPVGRLAAAADRVRRGELDVTVPVPRGRGEIARLGTSFNSMARSLEQSREELESQNTELEMQAIALEERQDELAAAADEARAQRDELSRTAGELEVEIRRAALHASFADRLAGARDVGALAAIALETLVSAAGADVGVLYAESWRDDTRWARLAVQGLEPAPLAEYAMVGGEGAGARAVSQRDVVQVRADAAGLRVRGLSGEAAVRWELHVPLSIGERAVGVVTLGA
jgi:CHASE3 domain sensor protein